MPYSVRIIQLLDKVEPTLREVLLEILAEIESQRKQWEESVTKDEFRELKAVVVELANAQKESERKLSSLTEKVKALAEAQEKTEQRLNQLAEAQEKTEQRLDSLTEKVEALAEAQEKTEQRLDSLTEKVKALAEAQEKTEQRLDSLTEKVKALAEAQEKTEQRLNQLAEAQEKTEQRLDSLTEKVEALAEAQEKTEQRLDSLTEKVKALAEAQEKTEQRLNQLAEAQKKTEEELKKLIGEHKKTRTMLGGLAHTVGYILEDRAYAALPHLLKKDFEIDAVVLKRDFVEVSPGKYEEVNIIGKGLRNSEEIWILGECKTQLAKRDVDSFLRKIARIESSLPGEKLLVMVTYQTSPQVANYVKEKGLKLYYSYQFPLVL